MAASNGCNEGPETKDDVEGKGCSTSSDSVPIRGILKAPSFQGSNFKRSIRWDEDKLNQMESLRGARMKIDEPKTPYVRSMKCDNLTEEERAELQRDLDDPDNEFELGSGYMSHSADGDEGFSPDEWDSDGYQDNAEEHPKESFEAKRAEHYNFREFVALSKKKLEEEEEENYEEYNDEDDNDEDDNDEDDNDEDDNDEDDNDEDDNDEDDNEEEDNEEDENENDDNEEDDNEEDNSSYGVKSVPTPANDTPR